MLLPLAILLAIAAAAALLLARRARLQAGRYGTLLEQLPSTTVVVFDCDLRIEIIRGAEARGIERDKLIGRRVDEILPPDAAAILVGNYRAVLAGEERSFEFRSPISDELLWIRAAPRIEGGEIVGGMAVTQNISEQRRAEREGAAEADRRKVILDAMNEAYVATDAAGVVTGWNRAAETTFGHGAEEAIGRSVAELIIPEEERADLWALLERRLPGQPAEGRYELRTERQAVHRDGHVFPVELTATLVEIDGESTLQSLMHDISDRKDAEAELRSHAADVEALADAVGELARSTVAKEARLAICRAAARIAGAQVSLLFEPDRSGRGLRLTASEGADLDGELLPFTERSGAVSAFSSCQPLFLSDLEGNPAVAQSMVRRTNAASALWHPVQDEETAVGVVAVVWRERLRELPERVARIMEVISAEAAVAIERAALLDRLERMARTDELTGLTNRRAWDLELSREIARARRESQPLAIAMMDLDRFKRYNDRLGHQAGDRLLKEAAGAWRGVLREMDLLARYGGEEFAVALPGCGMGAARRLVERLRAVTPAGESCSAGLACWDGVETPDELLGRADAALYEAKQTGRDRTVVA